MKSIVIAGSATVDIIKQIDNYPKRSSLTMVKDIGFAVGGAVCNTGINLKVLDSSLDVKPLALIGNDNNGERIIQALSKNNLDLSLIYRNDFPTAYTDVFNDKDGCRTMFHYQGSDAHLSLKHFEKLTQNNTEIVHIGYILLLDGLDKRDEKYGTKMAELLCSLQFRGIKTSIDVVSEEGNRFCEIVLPSLKYCDYLIINEIEGGKITNISPRDNDEKINLDSIKEILFKLKQFGVKRKVVIHCPECGAIINENNRITIIPSLDLPDNFIKGSVGAGDAFAAGCLYAFTKNLDDEYALRLASCMGASNLSAYDSISGAKKELDCLALEKQFKRKELF